MMMMMMMIRIAFRTFENQIQTLLLSWGTKTEEYYRVSNIMDEVWKQMVYQQNMYIIAICGIVID